MSEAQPTKEEIKIFSDLLEKYRFDLCRLVYVVFPFGQKGHALEHMAPYDWQMEEWEKLSKHLQNPLTRYETYKLIISSGNGAAKTAFGAITFFLILYTQQLRARITANTQPQMTSIVWPEYDIWFQHARYHDHYFEKLGQSIKAKDPIKGETWRLDAVTWAENNPTAMSGLHNKGKAVMYTFEEAPGIPHVIWRYSNGAFSDVDTIKIWLAFGNSDDPESAFEQNMTSPDWHSRRIDTREMTHVDKTFVASLLRDCNGNEDHDDFRVRVRGLPRKSSKDSIISIESTIEAMNRTMDVESLRSLPVILTCDPAWTGGDETVIGYRQGPYFKLLERFRLNKAQGQDHMVTFNRLCYWEGVLKADIVFIDQGEGTAIKTLANNASKFNWYLVSFANTPNDTPEFKDSEYANLRAQMYYMARDWLINGGVLDCENPDWAEHFQKQLCWTKGTRHKVHDKKLAEAKAKIKDRVGQSPDLADCFVLSFAHPVRERLPENQTGEYKSFMAGNSNEMPEYDPYENME